MHVVANWIATYYKIFSNVKIKGSNPFVPVGYVGYIKLRSKSTLYHIGYVDL